MDVGILLLEMVVLQFRNIDPVFSPSVYISHLIVGYLRRQP